MNIQSIKIALITLSFTVAACGAETDHSTGSIEDIDGTTYSHALHPDGQVDCASIHDALSQYGIDPALLEPEVVFQACVDSGDVTDDVCHQVAYSCFGDEGCADEEAGHEPDTSQINCDDVLVLVEDAGLDHSEVLQRCLGMNVDAETCSQIQACLEPGNPDDSGSTTGDADNPDGSTDASQYCPAVYEQLEQSGIDPASVSPDEVENACLDQGYDPDLCSSLASQCFPVNASDNTDGNSSSDGQAIDCSVIEQELAQQGYQTPLSDTEAEALRQQCLAQYSEDLCNQVYECVTNP